MSALWVFGDRLARAMVVIEEGSVSVTRSCEGGNSKMGVTGSRLDGNDGGIRRGRSARYRYGVGERTTLVSGFCVVWSSGRVIPSVWGCRRFIFCFGGRRRGWWGRGILRITKREVENVCQGIRL
jgi:hypothetical protein